MDTSSDKLPRLHTKWSGIGKEEETSREELNLLIGAENDSTKINYIKTTIDNM